MTKRPPDPAMRAKPQGAFLRFLDRLQALARKAERS